MKALNVPEFIILLTMSVTLADVWSCSLIIRVRVVLRGTVADWQQFFNRPLRWPPPDLSKRWKLVPNTILRRTTLTRAMKPHDKIFFIRGGAKLQRAKLPVTSTPSLVMLWCHWSQERKHISGISFLTRKWKTSPPSPSFPDIYSIPSLL